MKKIIDIRPPAVSKSSTPSRPSLTARSTQIGGKTTLRHAHDMEPFLKRTPRAWQARAQELIRMAALGLTMVMILNGINVYYRGLDVQQEVAGAAYESYEMFLNDGVNEESLEGFHSTLEEVQQELWFLQSQRATLWQDQQATHVAEAILSAGSQLSEAGALLMAFVEASKTISEDLLQEKEEGDTSLTEAWADAYQAHFIPALDLINQATATLAEVHADVLPQELQAHFDTLRHELGGVQSLLNEFNGWFPIVLRLLGDETPQRYLILLENNRESRPGGGFIGSYMILDLNDGYLEEMTFHDVYEIDGQYHESVEPPAEIARLTDEWRFRDSNYSPDLSVSSAKAAWFLEEEGGPGVDHVVTVDLSFVAELLGLIGPVQVPSLSAPLDQENFVTVLSYLVESKWSGEQTPKAILGEFVTEAIAQIRTQKPWDGLSQLFQTMAHEKHVSAYSKTESVQTFFEEFGLSGTLPALSDQEDVWMVVHTSIGGNKTDPWITQDVVHKTVLEEDGTVTNQVTLTREHTWSETDEVELLATLSAFGFTSPEPWLVDLLGRGTNVSALRLYVPAGSTLVDVQGVEESNVERYRDEDLELDYFYFTQALYPGEAATVTFTYTLPSRLAFEPLAEYRLTVFKQAGTSNETFTKVIQGSGAMTQVRSFPESLLENAHETGLGIYQWTTSLDRDLHIGQLWSQ